MKYFIVVFVFVLSSIFTSCDFVDNKLIIVNDTKDSIAFIIPAEPNYFPTSYDSKDSKIDIRKNDSLLNTFAKYHPHKESFGGVHFLVGDSTKYLHAFDIRWEDVINKTPDKKLKILFFQANIMTSGQYKWKDIYEKEMFKEMTYSIDELEKINWTIKYGKLE